jgi:hypothetical protein
VTWRLGGPDDLSGIGSNDIEDWCGKSVLKAYPTLALPSGFLTPTQSEFGHRVPLQMRRRFARLEVGRQSRWVVIVPAEGMDVRRMTSGGTLGTSGAVGTSPSLRAKLVS